MGRDSTTGSLYLFIGKTVSTVILAIAFIIIGYLLTQAELGLYAVAFIPASTILLFSDWGVSSALTRFCAQCRGSDNKEDLRNIIVSGLGFELATGAVLALISFLIANFLASTVFGKPAAGPLVAVMSTTLLSGSLLTATQSILVGFERMKLSSLIMLCQAILFCVLTPSLIFLGYGAFGAVLGYTVALAFAASIALMLLYSSIFRKLDNSVKHKPGLTETLKKLLHYGVPLNLGTIIGGVPTQLNSFLMVPVVGLALIGNYKISANFAVLLTFFTVPIGTVLFPVFSKLDPRKEMSLLKVVFDSSVKYMLLFLVPGTMGLMALAGPIIGTLYGDKWAYAPLFLSLSVIVNLYSLSGILSVNNVLMALGETKLLLKISIVETATGVPLAFLLIPKFGILGLIIVTLINPFLGTYLELRWAWKHYQIKANFQASARIFLASVISAGITFILLSFLGSIYWIQLVAGVAVFLATFLIAVPLVGALNKTDISNLRAMFSGFWLVSKLLEIPLTIIEKIIKISTHDKGQS